jgi:hypothetical protein
MIMFGKEVTLGELELVYGPEGKGDQWVIPDYETHTSLE